MACRASPVTHPVLLRRPGLHPPCIWSSSLSNAETRAAGDTWRCGDGARSGRLIGRSLTLRGAAPTSGTIPLSSHIRIWHVRRKVGEADRALFDFEGGCSNEWCNLAEVAWPCVP